MTPIRKRLEALEAKPLPPNPKNERLLAAIFSLWDGFELNAVPDPVTHCEPRMHQYVAAMLERMASNTLTEKDHAMLATVPECEHTVIEILEVMLQFHLRLP